MANVLGIPNGSAIKPIVEMRDLIYDRMEIKPDITPGPVPGSFYKLNPRIDDIPEKFMRKRNNVNLIVMGTVDAGGSGCVCPESTFLRELLKHLVLNEKEDIVMDMEAGIEHLGRSTAGSMDCLVIVVEPTLTSIETAGRIKRLAQDLKMNTRFIGNKIKTKQDEDFIIKKLGEGTILGTVSFYQDMNRIDKGGSIMDLPHDAGILLEVDKILKSLTKMESSDEQKKVTG